MLVVRDTFHPEEDLKRNWSAAAGGSINGEMGGADESEAKIEFAKHLGIELDEVTNEFRFHPAYNKYVAVHYEGLGAFVLSADTIEEAIKEASNFEAGLACTMESGNGHFFADDVISFHKVSEGRFVFEIKD